MRGGDFEFLAIGYEIYLLWKTFLREAEWKRRKNYNGYKVTVRFCVYPRLISLIF